MGGITVLPVVLIMARVLLVLKAGAIAERARGRERLRGYENYVRVAGNTKFSVDLKIKDVRTTRYYYMTLHPSMYVSFPLSLSKQVAAIGQSIRCLVNETVGIPSSYLCISAPLHANKYQFVSFYSLGVSNYDSKYGWHIVWVDILRLLRLRVCSWQH